MGSPSDVSEEGGVGRGYKKGHQSHGVGDGATDGRHDYTMNVQNEESYVIHATMSGARIWVCRTITWTGRY